MACIKAIHTRAAKENPFSLMTKSAYLRDYKLNQVLFRDEPIDDYLAKGLEEAGLMTADFWLALQNQYDEWREK